MTSRAAELLRRPERPRATYLELFFDLVFVLALARLSQGLLDDLAGAISTAAEPIRTATIGFYAHLVMVAGIIAVGDELVIQHPFGRTEPAWIAVFLGGPALFLAGRAGFEYQVFGRVSRSRLVGIVVLAVISPAMLLVPPLAVAAAAALVLAGVAVADAIRARRHPAEPPAPPR